MTPQAFVNEISNYGLAMYPDELENLLSLSKGTLCVRDNQELATNRVIALKKVL